MLHTVPPRYAAARASVPVACHYWPMPPQETLRHSKAGLVQSLVRVTAPFPGSWYTQGFVCVFWAPLAGMRFDFKQECTAPTILLGLLLCPWMWAIFFLVDSNILLSMVVQQLFVILVFSQKMSTCPSIPPSCFISIKLSMFMILICVEMHCNSSIFTAV